MAESILKTYSFLAKGGPVMGLLVLLSVVCVTFIVERFRSLRRGKILPARVLGEIESLVAEKKLSEALALCRASEVPAARILEAGLREPRAAKAEIREAMEMAGRREAGLLERNLNLLATLAAAGPLIGLFGTVTGMIRTFGVVGVVGVGDPIKLAGGISEALLSTAGGMAVGIPALVAQRYFIGRVDGFVLEMEEFCQRMLKLALRSE